MKRRWLYIAALASMAAGLVLAMTAPPDRIQGNLQRLMYVHVPAAWLAYLAFAMTLFGSVGWLARKDAKWDRLAAASAEVGVFFTGLTLVLGSIWGKPVWGIWWTWDPRLVTTALLFFVYLGYLSLRRSVDDATTRARRAAIYGVVAFGQVPIMHMSVVWWRSLHQPPTVLRPGDPMIDHVMLAALLANLVAFTLAYAVLVLRRMDIAALDFATETALAADEGPLAEAAIAAPRFEEMAGRA